MASVEKAEQPPARHTDTHTHTHPYADAHNHSHLLTNGHLKRIQNAS